MLTVEFTTQFKRDLRKVKKRGKKLHLIQEVIEKIAKQDFLNKKFRDHALIGNYVGFRELHIEPDWLLIYEVVSRKEKVVFIRTGTHADLFG